MEAMSALSALTLGVLVLAYDLSNGAYCSLQVGLSKLCDRRLKLLEHRCCANLCAAQGNKSTLERIDIPFRVEHGVATIAIDGGVDIGLVPAQDHLKLEPAPSFDLRGQLRKAHHQYLAHGVIFLAQPTGGGGGGGSAGIDSTSNRQVPQRKHPFSKI